MRSKPSVFVCVLAFLCPATAWSADPAPPVSVRFEPATVTLAGKWASQTLRVVGTFENGIESDVDANVQFASEDANIAAVDAAGIVTPSGDGQTAVVVTVPAGEAAVTARATVSVTGAGDGAADFLSHVSPLIDRVGCNAVACHGSAKGRGGLKLAMFGADPAADFIALTKQAAGRRIDPVEPAKSLLLLKTTAAIAHQGGAVVAPDSPQYQMLLAWITQGTPMARADAPTLAHVEVAPESLRLEPGQSRHLLVTAVYSDGSRRDATRLARFTAQNASVAAVDGASQKVTAAANGQSAVVVNFMHRAAVVRVVVPQNLPEPFPEMQAAGKIDEAVYAKLKELGIPPSDLCSDQEFLRRVYLDVIGTLPTAEQAQAFLADADPQKRAKLIDRLLASEEFADFWALKWGDLFRIKSEYPSNLWPNAVQAYHRWVRDSIVKNKPFDQFARELITASGSNFRQPAANYYRAFLQREPRNLGEVSALIFMGARIGCARCHAHPTESWSRQDNLELAAFFAQVRYKRTQEWKEEIVYVTPKGTIRRPGTGEVIRPRVPGGEPLELAPAEDPRAKFADWLTAPDNPWFARNAVNRIWFWLLGRGIVHEVDDMRSTNPPQNPELLDYLAGELVASRYDLKHVYRLVLNSRTYQLSSKSNAHNKHDSANFSHYQVKRLGAETLLDAIGHVTERWDTYQSRIPEPFVKMPVGYRATHLADGSIGIPFLELFGRPARDTAFESDRDLRLSMRQTLHLLNSSDVQNKINASPSVRRLLAAHKEDGPLLDAMFLTALSRPPSDQEKQKVLAFLNPGDKAGAEAAKKAADEALAAANAALAMAKTGYDAAEKAAKEAEAAAAQLNAQSAAEEAKIEKAVTAVKAADKSKQAAEAAKKTLDESAGNQRKAAEDALAGATTAAADAVAAKTPLDKPLADAIAAAIAAKAAVDIAEKAAQEAAVQSAAIAQDATKSDEEKAQAVAEATAKRQAADAAKAVLAQAEQQQQQAQSQLDAVVGQITQTEANRKVAEETLAGVNTRVTTAAAALQAAEKAAQDARLILAAAVTKLAESRPACIAAQNVAAEKRKLTDAAKAASDKATAEQQAAATKAAAANKTLAAASAPRTAAQRQQALQDVLWALLNTKEFLFNH